MQRLKKFSILLLSFLPITYAYGYEYIQIGIATSGNHKAGMLQIKKGFQFDNEDSEKNQAIISEIITGLKISGSEIDIIQLVNRNVGAKVLDLFIQGLKENFQEEIYTGEMNLSKNNIDYDTLKKFLNELSTEEVYKKFRLKALSLSNNQIRGLLDNTESCEILKNFLKYQPGLKHLNLSGNFNSVTAISLSKLYHEVKSATGSSRMKDLNFTINLNASSSKEEGFNQINQSILNEFLENNREDATEFLKKVRF